MSMAPVSRLKQPWMLRNRYIDYSVSSLKTNDWGWFREWEIYLQWAVETIAVQNVWVAERRQWILEKGTYSQGMGEACISKLPPSFGLDPKLPFCQHSSNSSDEMAFLLAEGRRANFVDSPFPLQTLIFAHTLCLGVHWAPTAQFQREEKAEVRGGK